MSFEQELINMRLARRYETHPFTQKMLQGTATEEQIKVLTYGFYFHTVGFINGLARLVSRCNIPELRMEVATGLYEEETGQLTKTKPHIELYYQFAKSMGITRQDLMQRAYMVPEVSALINWYMYASSNLSPLEGIAVFNVAAEGVNVTTPDSPGLSARMAESLKNNYGKTDEDIEFWTLHDHADQEHSSTGVRILSEFASTPEIQDRIRAAISMTQDGWWIFLDQAENRTLEDCTRYNSAVFY